ncbi:MAG: uracil-DNA glycosylase [Ichthyobacteriaceae bacterium]|nr:uracil-DNA glycosylase [Ichthyobacteriaceae bacterium]
MKIDITKDWNDLLKSEFTKDYFLQLSKFIENEYSTQTVFPEQENIFSAFNSCPINNLKVVIIGQDPYHGKGQAHGLSFSVKDDMKFPPSLRNILKEVDAEYNCGIPKSGNLTRWAEQGVLLINATFTVREKQPGSHQKQGWETFTDNVIKTISSETNNVVFMLWGAFAQKKESLIDASKHLVLKSAHPSPFSAHKGFLGNNHFVDANNYLGMNGKGAIVW